jgi:uncharacterized protein (TIGR03067 family)
MPDDIDALQGAWKVDSLKVEGQAMPDEMLAEAQIVVAGDRFTSTGMGAVYEGTLHLHAGATPRHIDMKFDAGPEKGNTNLGIYEIKGDRWKLCLATGGTVRPEKFAAPAGSGFALETLSRAGKTKRRAVKAPASGPATELEGEWSMLSGVMDGNAMDASLVQWVKRVTQGNRTVVLAGPQTMLKVAFTIDASQSPAWIDYVNLAGSHKGKSQQGIYKLEGDVLTVCTAAPGCARPRDFEPGAGRSLTVWKRQKL